MNVRDYVSNVVAKAEAAGRAVVAWLEAHPEVESQAALAATTAVADLKQAANTQVEAHDGTLPPEVGPALDLAIEKISAAANAQIAQINADTAAHVALLTQAKGAVAPA